MLCWVRARKSNKRKAGCLIYIVELTVSSGCLMRHDVVKHSPRSPISASGARTCLIYWHEVLTIFAQFLREVSPVAVVLRMQGILKFIGPWKVNATPNRAVRVGKTQSA